MPISFVTEGKSVKIKNIQMNEKWVKRLRKWDLI